MFADDAAQGFAFIDLCRERFDVVVMNPPFGEWSLGFKKQSKELLSEELLRYFSLRSLNVEANYLIQVVVSVRLHLVLVSFYHPTQSGVRKWC
jgi:23S rRNA G2445 N2-methylase RlmL